MMAITKQDIPAVVTIIVLNSLLYANFVTTTAYAQEIRTVGDQLTQAYEDLQEAERKQREIEERVSNATFFDAEDREEARRLWEQQHQDSINEVATALNVTRE